VIAADTTVVAPGGKRILGKPVDVRDAERMLRLISGRTHEVLTGYCLLGWDEKGRMRTWSRVVRSKVTMRKVSTAMIRDYVASGEPMDKAGSYAAQGFGMNWIQFLRGSYTNVVGLPMCELLMDLEEKFGVRPRSRQED
jgi:septum formation protein